MDGDEWTVRKIWRRVALLGWMAVIFVFSSQNAEQSGELSDGLLFDILNFLNIHANGEWVEFLTVFIRKAAHFSIYALLGALAYNLVSKDFGKRGNGGFLISSGICFLYAVSDEIHQLFVPGRSCSPWDVLLDLLGAVVGIWIWMCLDYFVSRRRKNG